MLLFDGAASLVGHVKLLPLRALSNIGSGELEVTAVAVLDHPAGFSPSGGSIMMLLFFTAAFGARQSLACTWFARTPENLTLLAIQDDSAVIYMDTL